MPAAPSTDVVCLGESMVTFVPTRPGPLAQVPAFTRGIGGAESNVACGLALLGHRARWISRLGTDGFGDHLLAAIAATGVDVRHVRRDPERPTGVYFRTAGERVLDGPGPTRDPAGASGPQGATGAPAGEAVYYRAGSAASALSPATVGRAEAWSGRILHLTGITPALSDGCLALVRELTTRRPGRPLVSFDVNYRSALWRRADRPGPGVLLDLARGCDLLFVGEDEASAAWGLDGADAVRAALPEPAVLVVKRGGAGATAYVRAGAGAGPAGATVPGARPAGPGPRATGRPAPDTVYTEPAPAVEVVAHVGAGDAFAAGYLSATLRGLPVARRLRHGHLMAAAALTVPGDLAAPPVREFADRLAALSAREWGRLRLGPGWTSAGPGTGTVTTEVPRR